MPDCRYCRENQSKSWCCELPCGYSECSLAAHLRHGFTESEWRQIFMLPEQAEQA